MMTVNLVFYMNSAMTTCTGVHTLALALDSPSFPNPGFLPMIYETVGQAPHESRLRKAPRSTSHQRSKYEGAAFKMITL